MFFLPARVLSLYCLLLVFYLLNPAPSIPQEAKSLPKGDRAVRKDPNGDPLPDGAVARVGTLRRGNPSAIQSVALSKDGKVLATGTRDGSVCLWEVNSGRELRRWNGHQGAVGSVAFSPDGRLLASSGLDNVIRLWDIASGKELRQLNGHRKCITSVVFSPDGDTLASASMDNTVRLWDVASGKELRQFTGNQDGASSIAFSPDGITIALGGWNTGYLWEASSGKQLLQFSQTRRFWVHTVAFAPDGQNLVAPGGKWKAGHEFEPALFLREVTTGRELRRFERQKLPEEDVRRIECVAFSPDGKTLASAEENNIYLWEVATGEQWRQLTGHRGPVFSAVFAVDGKTLVTGSRDGTALVWRLSYLGRKKGQELRHSAKELEGLWADLAAEDVPRVYRAIWALANAPEQALPFLKSRLRPEVPVEPQRIARLIRDLDHDQFQVRDKAERELAELGARARTGLHQALEGKSSDEVRRRVRRLLSKLNLPPERLFAMRAVQILEQIDAPEARDLLKALAEGAPGAWLTEEGQMALQRCAKRDPILTP